MPKVSVIMNCLNCSKYLREAINSVYAQTYNDWEIIFWDNASTDNSAEIAKTYDEKLRYFRSQETVPLGKARNLAIEKAGSDYIAFLDCDDLWLSQKLEKQIKLVEESNIGLIFSNTIFFYDNGKEYPYITKSPSKKDFFGYLINNYCISMDTAIVSKKAIESVGGFDESLHLMEDADLFMRIAHDFNIEYIHETLSRYRKHGGSDTFTKTRLFLEEWLYIKKKFTTIYPDFIKTYKKQIQQRDAREYLILGLRKWKEKSKKEAIQYLIELVRIDIKYLPVFCILLFPSSFYEVLQRIYFLSKRPETPEVSNSGMNGLP